MIAAFALTHFPCFAAKSTCDADSDEKAIERLRPSTVPLLDRGRCAADYASVLPQGAEAAESECVDQPHSATWRTASQYSDAEPRWRAARFWVALPSKAPVPW